jgi:hypothetical protein
MYSTLKLLTAAGLIAVSTADAQAPERALLSSTPTDFTIARSFSAGGSARAGAAPVVRAAGEQALLGRIHNSIVPTDQHGVTGAPIDGARALMGRRASAASIASDRKAARKAARSAFIAALSGTDAGSSTGEAEFGPVPSANASSSAFVVALGSRGNQSAILFSRASGTPLGVGRYHISDRGDGTDEILALVMTGSATNPTGVFRGKSGWLIVTAASDGVLTGRFHVDGVGFVAAEPEVEDRPIVATGSFSATAVNRFARVVVRS